ncbi:Uncharacterized protein APZ42_026009 [Daphnia magna]|uniref:Uncharacterized protein n=1 Tax=Daphnia magna TaxID=35525 RepID=A0A164SK22_9CRUS|nr:Uncharacterized protein APZ42_026009 [Daphnia magna]
MVNDKNCKDNNMQSSPTTISFTATPTGEGARYATREYHEFFLYLELTNTYTSLSILLDSTRQIEITFLNKPDRENKELTQPGYKVLGIPLTFRIFQPKASAKLYHLYKLTLTSCLAPLTWLLLQIADTEFGKRLYNISYAGGPLILGHLRGTQIIESGKVADKNTIVYIFFNSSKTTNQLTIHHQFYNDDPLPAGTDLEYIVHQTIRIRKTDHLYHNN